MKRLFALIGATAMLAAGCGTTDPSAEPLTKAEYQDAITRIVVRAGQAEQLFADVVTSDRPDCAAKVGELHAALERLVDDAADLTPPDDVAAAHREFAAEARVSADAVGDAAVAAEAGDLTCGDPMNRAIYGLPSTDRAEQALLQIQEKGYRIFGE
jgi:hypothetical protein